MRELCFLSALSQMCLSQYRGMSLKTTGDLQEDDPKIASE